MNTEIRTTLPKLNPQIIHGNRDMKQARVYKANGTGMGYLASILFYSGSY
jgi:hypothetical protein